MQILGLKENFDFQRLEILLRRSDLKTVSPGFTPLLPGVNLLRFRKLGFSVELKTSIRSTKNLFCLHLILISRIYNFDSREYLV